VRHEHWETTIQYTYLLGRHGDLEANAGPRGVPLPYVSELLGHHSAAFTATVYAQALPNATRGIMARLDGGVIGTPKRNPAATVAEATVALRESAVS
jgi:integrase